jgi:hypothetical protein
MGRIAHTRTLCRSLHAVMTTLDAHSYRPPDCAASQATSRKELLAQGCNLSSHLVRCKFGVACTAVVMVGDRHIPAVSRIFNSTITDSLGSMPRKPESALATKSPSWHLVLAIGVSNLVGISLRWCHITWAAIEPDEAPCAGPESGSGFKSSLTDRGFSWSPREATCKNRKY